ncbi:MAG: hypothetical protein BGO31_05415 [Bacteroidetes bacterium 43-16]|uniref:hypothetical protein n=1 Tax=uncultured Dysgonomonas sp. TaxID=206096 RepID=UPI00092A079A|nr:hypothetical protein [uncultured Dysgonomonas sp.]OJV52271.1 MAG: hypothetical protein BGO31_05415 [Bacteroidetes bacterium 43-16]
MLQISWNNYWTAVAIILVIYYLAIAVLYYRSEIAAKIKKQMQAGSEDLTEKEDEQMAAPTSFNELETIVANIKGTLEEAGTEAGKEELLDRLGKILASYDGLDTPAFRVAINNYIIGHAQKICGTGFTEEELNRYWLAIRA